LDRLRDDRAAADRTALESKCAATRTSGRWPASASTCLRTTDERKRRTAFDTGNAYLSCIPSRLPASRRAAVRRQRTARSANTDEASSASVARSARDRARVRKRYAILGRRELLAAAQRTRDVAPVRCGRDRRGIGPDRRVRSRHDSLLSAVGRLPAAPG